MAYSSIAFIAAHRLGDALGQTPTIRYLKQAFPDSELSVITVSPEASTVFQGNPNISRIYNASNGIPEELYGLRFDLTISSCGKKHAIPILQSTFGPQLLISGITQQTVTEKSNNPQKNIFESLVLSHVSVSLVTELCRLFGLKPDFNDYCYELPFSKNDQSNIDKKLQKWGIESHPLISLHLGCRSVRKRFSFGKKELAHEKAWRLKNATRFCQLLAEHHPEVRCLATGTQGEGTYTRQLAKTCPNVIDAVDLFSIKEAAALMHKLTACIVPDTGMLHIASTTPVHIVGLYAVTDPAITGPYPGRTAHTPIQRDSMDAITGDMVFDAVTSVLQTSNDPTIHVPSASDFSTSCSF
jgi:ADP-heptose:LPS heptosyltransferase